MASGANFLMSEFWAEPADSDRVALAKSRNSNKQL